MSSIKTLFEEAICYEEHVLAHYIFCLIQEGKIAWDDEDSVLFEVQPDIEKLTNMIENNFLGICKIHMYALKVKKGKWVFIFAKSPEEAKVHLWRTTGSKPLNCQELSLDQEVLIGNRFLNFREWKKEQSGFPCLVGYC
ncbi:hypothetical protein KHA94_19335 [Bacillus sp. FJAT-49705]|uniref:Uncharacterized protein n=1 Tax=Cytobacillus citreus TaxID=2833586 RepID=A0ABS5NZ08_9BACI|nr:hypothetical protein [Cytobacillus citreus]MBS4192318.1 hypothetical protein [Cytobacillus citreus]